MLWELVLESRREIGNSGLQLTTKFGSENMFAVSTDGAATLVAVPLFPIERKKNPGPYKWRVSGTADFEKILRDPYGLPRPRVN